MLESGTGSTLTSGVERISFDEPRDISIRHDDDAVLIHFGQDTLGINPTSDGYTVTPDWNDRRFTLAFSEDSFLYHLTDEARDEKRGGEGNIAPAALMADLYVVARGIGHTFPVSHLEEGQVGKLDFDDMVDYLIEKDVIQQSDTGLEVNDEKREQLQLAYEEDPEVRAELFGRILSPVPVANLEESGENIFLDIDDEHYAIILLLYPDGYITAIRPDTLVASLEEFTGARVMDLVFQALGG